MIIDIILNIAKYLELDMKIKVANTCKILKLMVKSETSIIGYLIKSKNYYEKISIGSLQIVKIGDILYILGYYSKSLISSASDILELGNYKKCDCFSVQTLAKNRKEAKKKLKLMLCENEYIKDDY